MHHVEFFVECIIGEKLDILRKIYVQFSEVSIQNLHIKPGGRSLFTISLYSMPN